MRRFAEQQLSRHRSATLSDFVQTHNIPRPPRIARGGMLSETDGGLVGNRCATLRPSTWRSIVRYGLSFAVLGLAGCGSYVDRHLAEGDALFEAKKYREAIDHYGKALRFSSSNPRGIRRIGLAHYYLGELRGAYPYLAKAEELQSGDVDVNIALGNIYLIDRLADSALRSANTILERDSGNVAALRILGTAYLAKQAPTKAADAYRRILRVDPRDSSAHYFLGASLLAEGKRSEAKQELQTALSLSPKSASALARLIEIGFAERRGGEALAAASRHIAAAGKTGPLMRVLGDGYVSIGDVAAAETAYREAIELDPQFVESRIALAGLYFNSKRPDEAQRLLGEAIKIDSLSVPAYVLRGIVFQSAGDTAQAQASYEKALALNPRQATAANNLALLLVESANTQGEAVRLAALAYEIAPNDPHFADTFGWILYRRGNLERALLLLKQSAEKLPDEPAAQYHLGMALLRAGAVEGARRALTSAVSSPTSFAEREEARRVLASLK